MDKLKVKFKNSTGFIEKSEDLHDFMPFNEDFM